MKLGRNIRGGRTSWTTLNIRHLATVNGGVPDYELAVHADNGDCVVWHPDGEVRTVIEAINVITTDHKGRAA